MSIAVGQVLEGMPDPAGLHRIEADVRPENAPSERLARGEIDAEEFRVRRAAIAEAKP